MKTPGMDVMVVMFGRTHTGSKDRMAGENEHMRSSVFLKRLSRIMDE